MAQKKHTQYSASFTAGSLLHRETSALLPLLKSEDSAVAIREEVKRNQILHINFESARKRIITEIVKRTKSATESFWNLYAVSNEEEQKILLFFLCLKTYPLMLDFQINVTLRQWNSSSQTVEPYFYQMEIEKIAIHDKVVSQWADITKRKTISVYLRILKEIKMLNNKSQLQSITIGDSLGHYFTSTGEKWFLEACLLSNCEIERIMQL